ncbi:MAG: hypothetical protein ACOYNI_12170 [Acidimicrobiia bacterium]
MSRRSRTDRLVLIMGLAALGAGVFVALLLAVVSGQKVRNVPTSVSAGNVADVRQVIGKKGALYFTGGKVGVWLTEENGQVIALVPEATTPRACVVTYDTSGRYFRCRDGSERVDPATLARRPVTIDDKQQVRVNLRDRLPAPGATAG